VQTFGTTAGLLPRIILRINYTVLSIYVMKTFNKKLNVLKLKKRKLPQKSHNLHKNKILTYIFARVKTYFPPLSKRIKLNS
jgi:hypothetical protein